MILFVVLIGSGKIIPTLRLLSGMKPLEPKLKLS